MHRTSICACLIAASALAQAPVSFNVGNRYQQQWPRDGGTAQAKGVIMTGSATSVRGVAVGITTVAEPPLKARGSFGGGLRMNSDATTIHRLLFDRDSETYFGYDLTIEAGDAQHGYRVAFQPLSNAQEMMNDFASGVSLKSLAAPRYPPAQFLHIGETVALDLMISSDGHQKIVDYLHFQEPPPSEPPAMLSTVPARDYSLDDERPTLSTASFLQTAVFVNGRKFGGRTGFSDGKGGTYWLAMPNRGRYILSLVYQPGLTRIGEMHDNTIVVQDGDRRYEVRLAQPMTKPGDAWNLYGVRDPFFEPLPGQSDAAIVGVGRLERLLPKP